MRSIAGSVASCVERALLGGVVAASLGATAVQAAPSYETFGALPQATFGGDGIPNDDVAIATFSFGGGSTVTLGLTAHQRYFNPPLGNDGAGTFFAQPGANTGGPGSPSAVQGALWNFAFFVGVEGGASLADLGRAGSLLFRYDADPADGVDFGVIDLGFAALAAVPPAPTVAQDSQNMLFGFLYASVPPFLTAPSAASFDPNASGVYTFELSFTPYSTVNSESGFVSIDVVVGEAPEPAAIGLLGLGLLGLAGARRRRA